MPGSLRALRLQNLILGGGLTAAQLEAELSGSTAKAGAFAASLRQRVVSANYAAAPTAQLAVIAGSASAMSSVVRQSPTVFAGIVADNTLSPAISAASWAVIVASSSAMAALFANSAAMAGMAASVTGMAAIVASAVAMNAVAANSAAVTALMGNTVARGAIFGSDLALSTLASSTTAQSAMRASTAYLTKTISNGSATAPVSLGLPGNSILVDFAGLGGASYNLTFTGRRAGSVVGSLGPMPPGATSLPGTFNIMALTNTATVATAGNINYNTYIGYIPV